MQYANVLIVGGGPAGLTTAGALAHRGITSVMLDKASRIGTSWAERYDRLHLHTERRFSGLAHYPIPPQLGKYVAKNDFAGYLQWYANRLGLDWRGNHPVHQIRLEPNGGANRFVVETDNETWTSAQVVVATGHFGKPVLSPLAGANAYKGELCHSVHYRTGRAFRGKRVLVVGAGNSGAEIAADLAEQGAGEVTLAIRRMPTIVPREWLGVSAQALGMALTPLPPALADRIGLATARLALGDLSRYGLTKPDWHPFTAKRIPIIDVGLVKELKAGRVTIRRHLVRLTTNGAQFADGSAGEYDAVIAATGFESGLPAMLDVPGVLNARGEPLAPSGEPTAVPGLYFVGYVYSHRGHLFEANRASRKLAERLKGETR